MSGSLAWSVLTDLLTTVMYPPASQAQNERLISVQNMLSDRAAPE
jgi:hypothetical protein